MNQLKKPWYCGRLGKHNSENMSPMKNEQFRQTILITALSKYICTSRPYKAL